MNSIIYMYVCISHPQTNDTPSPPIKSFDFRGFDTSRLLMIIITTTTMSSNIYIYIYIYIL